MIVTNDLVIKPQPGGQTEFLSRPEFEVLFGGSAGPGKTWSLVIDSMGLQFEDTPFGMKAIEHPDYRGILFRRETTQLSKLIDEGKKYYSDFGAVFIQGRRGDPGSSFNFPSGARIFLSHMQEEKDKEKIQGIEFQYIGFDELTHFLLSQYLYAFSRSRSTLTNNGYSLPARVRSTTNPTGTGLPWVKKRFIKNGANILIPKKTYWFIADSMNDIEDNPQGISVPKGTKHSKTRTFIPGYLQENKILMDADPDYASNIIQMGKKYEKALLHGDWDAFGGDFFEDFSRNDMGVKPFEIPNGWYLVGSIDPGWSSPCSFGLTARDYEGNTYRLFTYYVRKRSPQEHAEAIYNMIKNFPFTKGRMPDMIVSGRDAFQQKDLNSINRTELTFSDIFRDKGMYLQPAVTDRILGWWVMKQYMRNKKWYYFEGYNDSLIDEITAAQQDENNVEDLAGGGNDPNVSDHALDECRYSLMALPQPTEPKYDNLPDWAKKKLKSKNNYSVLGV